jgi:hypothetical protein
MLDEWVKPCVFGDDMEIAIWILQRQLAHVKCDVEVQRVLSIAGNFNIFPIVAETLHRRCKVKGDFGLIGADKHENLEGMLYEDL